MAPEHFEEVIQLWDATDGVMLTDTDTPTGLTSYLTRNPELSYVAVTNDRIIGAVLCGHDGRRGYLHHLSIIPEFRSQGIGRQLVAACLDSLKSTGIKRCNLFVFTDNEPGKEFWLKDNWFEWSEIRMMQRVILDDS